VGIVATLLDASGVDSVFLDSLDDLLTPR
jgi:hypothetical protein